MPIRAGRVFWSIFTPALGLIALLALATSFGVPPRHLALRVAASGLLLMVSTATLFYFRPAIIGMVVEHGAGRTPEALGKAAHLWVALNWVRILAVAVSLAMSVRALLLPLRRTEASAGRTLGVTASRRILQITMYNAKSAWRQFPGSNPE